MLLIVLEALGALLLLVLIVWWTMFSGRKKGELLHSVGISTDKLHARGPVGLEGLTSLKWVVFGDGHIRT